MHQPNENSEFFVLSFRFGLDLECSDIPIFVFRYFELGCCCIFYSPYSFSLLIRTMLVWLLVVRRHNSVVVRSRSSTNSHKMNFPEFTLIQNELQSAIEWANNVRRAPQRSSTLHTHTRTHTERHTDFSRSEFYARFFSNSLLLSKSIFRYFTAAALFDTFFLFLFFLSYFSHRSSLFFSVFSIIIIMFFFTIILLVDRKLYFLLDTHLNNTQTHKYARV